MIIRTLFFIIAALAGLGVILYNIIKFLISINKGKSRLYKEINTIRNAFDSSKIDLVPIDKGELGNLSHNKIVASKIKSNKSNVMTSIYNEPFVAYQSKEIDGKDKAVLVAYTAEHEFSYIFNNGIIDIFINEEPYARMFKDGKVKDLDGKVIG